MTKAQWVMVICSVASLAVYVGCCICLARKATKLPLLRDEPQDDQRSQRGRY